MKRTMMLLVVALVMALMRAVAGAASATIHPIVESYDCANQKASENHPLGDPADPPGQTPGYGSHSDQSTLRAIQESNERAWFGHKLDGKCGKVGQ